jgi:tRNA A-37 threonylcarbamoyl transferase component Bud32
MLLQILLLNRLLIPSGRFKLMLDMNENQYETVQLNGWAYLLSEIGEPFQDDTLLSKSDLLGIITALVSLHNSGRAHGDARIQNFVKVNDRWKIIDIRGAVDVATTIEE